MVELIPQVFVGVVCVLNTDYITKSMVTETSCLTRFQSSSSEPSSCLGFDTSLLSPVLEKNPDKRVY